MDHEAMSGIGRREYTHNRQMRRRLYRSATTAGVFVAQVEELYTREPFPLQNPISSGSVDVL
jgi:hypothetical protein